MVTYSSRNRISRTNSSSSNSGDPPPLAILPPPEQIHYHKSTSQYDSTGEQLALSKAIYGIRDAFRNVINTAFGCGSDELHTRSSASSAMSVDRTASSSKGRVVSLAGLCAIAVGKELAAGQGGDGEDEEENAADEECGNEEEEETKWMDDIYEEIPFHVRRCVLSQHFRYWVGFLLGLLGGLLCRTRFKSFSSRARLIPHFFICCWRSA